MALLSTLFDRIHDEFPSVPDGLAERALSDSVKEFCSLTHAWQETMPRVSLRVGTSTYELYPDTGIQIVALKEVRLDGRRVHPTSAERMRLRAYSPAAGSINHYTQTWANVIELTNAPSETAHLTVRAALTLSLGATETEVPDILMDEYGEAFAAGAKMRLLRQANQPWTSPDGSVLYANSYYAAITSAKARTMGAMGEADSQIEMRPWA